MVGVEVERRGRDGRAARRRSPGRRRGEPQSKSSSGSSTVRTEAVERRVDPLVDVEAGCGGGHDSSLSALESKSQEILSVHRNMPADRYDAVHDRLRWRWRRARASGPGPACSRSPIRRFAADGYRRTSVSDIAREAGLTPGRGLRLLRRQGGAVPGGGRRRRRRAHRRGPRRRRRPATSAASSSSCSSPRCVETGRRAPAGPAGARRARARGRRPAADHPVARRRSPPISPSCWPPRRRPGEVRADVDPAALADRARDDRAHAAHGRAADRALGRARTPGRRRSPSSAAALRP